LGFSRADGRSAVTSGCSDCPAQAPAYFPLVQFRGAIMQQAFFIPSRVCVFAFTSQFAAQAQTKANGKGQATLEISKQPG
jgi:hypothetical protein